MVAVLMYQTIGVDFCMKVVNIPDTGDVNTQVELYLFDSAGQSIFNQRDLGTKHVSCPCYVSVVDLASRAHRSAISPPTAHSSGRTCHR